MSRNDTWMPLYIGDYLADTSRLTTEQHGAYLLILMDYWRNGAPPDDDTVLASIAKLSPAQWRKHAPAIRSFFVCEGGLLIQKRADQERAKAGVVSSKRSASGKAGAAKRWGKQDGKSDGNKIANAIANAIPEPWQNDAPSQSQSPIQKEESARNASIAERAPDDEPPETQGHAPTPAGAVCQAMRRAGLQATNPGDPRLLALIEQGATLPEFEGIAAEAVSKGKGWAWVLTVLPARRIEAAAIALPPAQQADPMAWTVSRRGVITRACELGIGPWDESNAAAGTGPSWPEYRAEVIAADAAQRQGIAA